METRTIIVESTRSQSKVELTTDVETLGELKDLLRAQNFDFKDMSFFEGVSHTELKSDDSILPKDLPWKGKRTNNLYFLLTEGKRKIRNGAVTTRAEAYAYIKANNLGESIKKKFGKNFTNVPTADLIAFCTSSEKKKKNTTIPQVEKKVAKSPAKMPVLTKPATLKNILTVDDTTLKNLLIKKGIISQEEYDTFKKTGELPETDNVQFSAEDIRNMKSYLE